MKGVRKSIGGIAVCALGAAVMMALIAAEPARAACTTAGSIVTCSGTTVAGGNGFGNGTQSNLTINVETGASVTGGNDGLSLNSDNTVNNSGTITGTSYGRKLVTG